MAATLPPPQPAYVLRGHAAPVHTLQFSQSNSKLLSADAEGFVVCWSLASKRAIASWQGHTNAVLGVAWLTEDLVVTHGRDSKLHIWQLGSGLETVLPVDKKANEGLSTGKTPAPIHSMTVNTLNFCSFAATSLVSTTEAEHTFLLALPHTLSSEAVDIFSVTVTDIGIESPNVQTIRKTTIAPPDPKVLKTGLTMCLCFYDEQDLLVGYEGGQAIVFTRAHSSSDKGSWQYHPSYISKPHTQPVLSISSIPQQNLFVTSAADSKLVTHKLPHFDTDVDFVARAIEEPIGVLDTKHAGQQGLSIRDDNLVIATAGWDGKGRVYRAPKFTSQDTSMGITPAREIAVLKWHKDGCYCTAFAHIRSEGERTGRSGINSSTVVIAKSGPIMTAAQRREDKAKSTHWIALGSKDGKISLWDIL